MSSGDIGWMVTGLTQLLTLAVLARKFSGAAEARRIEPQPLRVQPEPVYQDKGACEGLHKKLDDRLERMNMEHSTRTEALRKEIKDDVNSIYSRINSMHEGINNRFEIVLTRLGELRGPVYTTTAKGS